MSRADGTANKQHARLDPFAQRRQHQGLHGRGDPRAITGHHDGNRCARFKQDAAVLTVMQPARQIHGQRREIEFVSRQGDFATFEFAELAHFRHESAEAAARSVGFFQHLLLLFVERASLFAEQHAQIARDDGNGGAELVNGQRHRPRYEVVFDSHAPVLDLLWFATVALGARLWGRRDRRNYPTLTRGLARLNLIRRPLKAYNYAMVIKHAPDIRSSEITPKSVYLRRREFLQASAAAMAVAGFGALAGVAEAQGRVKLKGPIKKSSFSTTEKVNLYDHVTSYNNFYEFGTGKDEPKVNARNFRSTPWTLEVEGEVAKPAKYALEDFIKPYALEERIYRMRCVEAWSMVIPWVGIPLKDVIDRVQPTGKAQYVEFLTLHDVARMPMQRSNVLDWPYIEGLRLDEARHPLSLLAVGIYDEVLPAQNGAPIRLVVPWKYGFKGGKSIVKMRFVEKQPRNTWQVMAAHEYGFYANVNPNVDHPRWSQARERRLPDILATTRTQMFNGYGDQVASLYSGMDLRKNY
jgi:sulfoxide reductase catalytic subunit YedY